MSNDEYRLTQYGIGLSDNGCYVHHTYVGTMARARVELAYKTSPHLLTKDNASPSETMA